MRAHRAAIAAIMAAAPDIASAQAMGGMAMPMPAAQAAPDPVASTVTPIVVKPDAASATGPDGMSATALGTGLPAGDATPPPVPTEPYADRQYPTAAIAAATRRMMQEQGRQQLHQVMFNLAEFQVQRGHDGYRWDGEAWFGGDIDRAELRTEGTGVLHDGTGNAEVQALYSRAIGPYFNLEAGIRQDFSPTPARTYATIGVEGLAPFLFQTEARLFVSTHGDVLGRLEAWTDLRITQRLVAQPRVELNLSARDAPDRRIGSGLSDAELGLRLRYEIARQFAPYIGISYEADTGPTARYARADGKGPTTTSFVTGVRFWF